MKIDIACNGGTMCFDVVPKGGTFVFTGPGTHRNICMRLDGTDRYVVLKDGVVGLVLSRSVPVRIVHTKVVLDMEAGSEPDPAA